ncbi:MAG TPA: 2OG-Fe(II) oxygenase family protein [Terricaulis sp.]|nr:2OG-Fe(II) oxygenase family protein [Terricaulis sp.]HRP10386.1 2OG-Fe(II) oxygenase family protein [Terricaulis sp.]
MLNLRLNPALDIEAHARTYAAHRIVQIPDVFDAPSSAALEQTMQKLPWRLVYQDDALAITMETPAQFAQRPERERQSIISRTYERAAQGIGFTYYTYPMIQARVEGWDLDHPIHSLTDFLNAPPFLTLARRIINHAGLTKIDAHASFYRPGDYLTMHRDVGSLQERRAAYTLGFSRDWRPDWGGLLLFNDDARDVTRGFLPRFNTLTVFDGLIPHTVTQVASFAPNPRLTVAGWFRDDPPYKR